MNQLPPIGPSNAGPSNAVVNDPVYLSPRRVREYANRSLISAERVIFDELRSRVSGKSVLELGCGAGALTEGLLSFTDRLVGIDISPAMIEHCRARFPGGDFRVGDLRGLKNVPGAPFDAVVAGANVLDVLEHGERDGVLSDIRGLLAPGGLLYFSTHNRSSHDALRQSQEGPRLRRERSPVRQGRALGGYVLSTINHRRLARRQRFEPGWAIVNDSAHLWGLLHHYVTKESQLRDLERVGLEAIGVWGTDGVPLSAADDGAAFTELHYLARAEPRRLTSARVCAHD